MRFNSALWIFTALFTTAYGVTLGGLINDTALHFHNDSALPGLNNGYAVFVNYCKYDIFPTFQRNLSSGWQLGGNYDALSGRIKPGQASWVYHKEMINGQNNTFFFSRTQNMFAGNVFSLSFSEGLGETSNLVFYSFQDTNANPASDPDPMQFALYQVPPGCLNDDLEKFPNFKDLKNANQNLIVQDTTSLVLEFCPDLASYWLTQSNGAMTVVEEIPGTVSGLATLTSTRYGDQPATTTTTPTSSPLKKPTTSSPVKQPTTSSPIKPPTTSSPIKPPTTSSPIRPPTTSSPVKSTPPGTNVLAGNSKSTKPLSPTTTITISSKYTSTVGTTTWTTVTTSSAIGGPSGSSNIIQANIPPTGIKKADGTPIPTTTGSSTGTASATTVSLVVVDGKTIPESEYALMSKTAASGVVTVTAGNTGTAVDGGRATTSNNPVAATSGPATPPAPAPQASAAAPQAPAAAPDPQASAVAQPQTTSIDWNTIHYSNDWGTMFGPGTLVTKVVTGTYTAPVITDVNIVMMDSDNHAVTKVTQTTIGSTLAQAIFTTTYTDYPVKSK